jgi:hypothetical protein
VGFLNEWLMGGEIRAARKNKRKKTAGRQARRHEKTSRDY